MKNVFKLAIVAVFFFVACNDNEPVPNQDLLDDVEAVAPLYRGCASADVHAANLAKYPHLQAKMNEIESFTQDAIQRGRLVNGHIEIPVYVHVLYRTNSENISDAQINSQIDVLNEDFNLANADASNAPAEFAAVQGNSGIQFVLEGITRKSTKKRSWRVNDDMKKSSKGGVDPITPETHLNIWVVGQMSQGGTILGYAQFPGGNPATDGIVVGHNFFGRVGTLYSPFDLGRTATHEVGHYLNLRHIWGDGGCGASDFVSDTPDSDGPNYGCPSYPSVACGSNDMTMNFMDYTDDACMYMFSEGQVDRMLAIFASGGPREVMGQP
jgi:hypothetical protein